MLLRARHTARLVREIFGYAVVNRVVWPVPVVLALLVLTAVIVVGQTAAPLTLYTVF